MNPLTNKIQNYITKYGMANGHRQTITLKYEISTKTKPRTSPQTPQAM